MTFIETLITIATLAGLTFSTVLLIDAVRDYIAIRRNNLPRSDPRRFLNLGLTLFAASYTLLKIALLYATIIAVTDVLLSRSHTIILRTILTTTLISCDIGVGMFWLLRRRAL